MQKHKRKCHLLCKLMTERFHFLRYFRFFGRSWQNIASKAAAPTAPSHSSGIRICPTKSKFPISAQTAVHPLATAAHCTFRSFAIQPQITPDATAPSSAAQRRSARQAVHSSRPSSPARCASYPFVSCPSGIPPSPPLYGPVLSKRTVCDFLLHRKRPCPSDLRPHSFLSLFEKEKNCRAR